MAQDEAVCLVFGVAKEATALGGLTVVPLDRIAAEIITLVG